MSCGAKFSPFAGYSMPINYSQGIIKEHLHTRKFVSVFDISHMGQILIPSSQDNSKKLEKFIPLDLNNLKLHNSLYSFISIPVYLLLIYSLINQYLNKTELS